MKHRDYNANVAQTIEIEPIDMQSKWYPQNVCAYIDVGFVVKCRDQLTIIAKQDAEGILKDVASVIAKATNEYSISIIGSRIIITLFHRGANDDNGKEISIDSGIQNFIEIQNDGSVRFRIIITNTKDAMKASITVIGTLTYIFQEIYSTIVGADFDKIFVYASKYEKLTVLRQFIPYYYLDETNTDVVLKTYTRLESSHKATYGENHVVIGNRFPSNGYLLIDHHLFDKFEIKWNTHNIIQELLSTVFDNLGFVELPIIDKNE